MAEQFLNGRVALYPGDCLEVLARLAENSIDACVCDPPYHLTSIIKRFGNEAESHLSVSETKNLEPIKAPHYKRLSRGFMGKKWDGGDVAFDTATWRAVYRVLKPGAHLVAFGGTRTYHRMACAIEDAGFEIRDSLMWVYGSGFPKSHDVSKGIDKAAAGKITIEEQVAKGTEYERTDKGNPITDDAITWEGWHTALKPALEPIVLARKPLSEGTVAANVLRWGTGALNIDACRIAGWKPQVMRGVNSNATSFNVAKTRQLSGDSNEGRWPANVVHDGSDEVVGAFPNTHARGNKGTEIGGGGMFGHGKVEVKAFAGDSGSAARFFFTAKADSDDRLGSSHPTVKPLDLMQWLVRLVTPPKGVVLDPFAGTGTTGEAAWREGMNAALIEHEEEYQADIRRRMKLCLSGPDERSRESIKAKGKPVDYGPLFGVIE